MEIREWNIKLNEGIILKFSFKFHSHTPILHTPILSERFSQIHEKPMRALPPPSIINGNIGAGIFVEFNA